MCAVQPDVRAMTNNGEACILQSRILAPRSLYEGVADAVGDVAEVAQYGAAVRFVDGAGEPAVAAHRGEQAADMDDVAAGAVDGAQLFA